MGRDWIVDVEPVDGFSFRDARLFEAGESSAGGSPVFPPAPQAFYAAIRDALRNRGVLGTSRKGLRFSIMGPAINAAFDAHRPNLRYDYFPVPADLWQMDPKSGEASRNSLGCDSVRTRSRRGGMA